MKTKVDPVNLEIIIQCRTVMTHCHVTICLINDWFKVKNCYCLNCKQNTRKFQAKPNMLTFCKSNVLFTTVGINAVSSTVCKYGHSSCSLAKQTQFKFKMKQKVSFVGTVILERKTKTNEVKTLLDIDIINFQEYQNSRFDLQDSKFSRTEVGSLPVRSFELMSSKSETLCVLKNTGELGKAGVISGKISMKPQDF